MNRNTYIDDLTVLLILAAIVMAALILWDLLDL